MYLKSLVIKGFKSFADTTRLDLEPGVTVVVGPNGSGKSNVVDALAWVLGAQGPRSMRSTKMDDVIFAGTSGRSALGRAEVAITIDNGDGLLPIEFSEVTISRTLFRSGDSEYAINGVSCRLLDIQELLSDSGVGRQQHIIIAQGQIDAVLAARGEERRSVIEEAAGVLKFRRRKERAERRLTATEANLVRVQDLLREVRRQIRPLQRQAEAAARHEVLEAEARALRIAVAGRELVRLDQALALAENEQRHRSDEEARLRSELAELDATIGVIEAELSEVERDDASDVQARWEALSERVKGLRGQLRERARYLAGEREKLLDEAVVATLEAEAADLVEQVTAVEAEIATLVPELEDLARREQALADQRERAGVDQLEPDPELAQRAARAAEVRSRLAALRSSHGRLRTEAEAVGRRHQVLLERQGRFIAEQSERQTSSEQARAQLVTASAEAERFADELVELEESASEAAKARAEARSERDRWVARLGALDEALALARDRAGVGRVVEIEGVLGSLLEMLEVDPGWEAAVEAALGEAVRSVVVRHPEAARRVLARLAGSEQAGAVLALGVELPTPAVALEPAAEAVRDHVRCADPALVPVLDSLLARAVRVPGGWEQVLDAALERPDLVVVSDQGHRFDLSGWRLGGDPTGATGASRDEAAAAAESAERHLDEAATLAVELDAEVARRRQLARAAATRVEELTRRLDDDTRAIERLRGSLNDLESDLAEAERRRSELEQAVADDESDIAGVEAELPSLVEAEQQVAEWVRHRDAQRSTLDQQARAVAALRRDLDSRTAALEERRSLLLKRSTTTEARLQRYAQERETAATRRRRLDDDAQLVDRMDELARQRAERVEASLATLRERWRARSAAVRQRLDELDARRRERAERERRLEAVREKLRRVEIERTEQRVRLQQVSESVRGELEVEPSAARQAPLPDLPEGVSPAARLAELERELKLLGPVNPLAVEEFDALTERRDFLEGQLDDVRSTRRELSRVISAVDEEIMNRFAGAFADVSQNFERLFASLFPGGTGRLHLTDPADLLGTGIEIEARPSGKNVKRLSLLSGGERSLAALAFLFAVFRSRPSPFYVMDEVEAALDDVNLHRFLALVGEFRDEAQLIIVSHQKRTMEAADCLFGVTMQPGGSSRVVSERLRGA